MSRGLGLKSRPHPLHRQMDNCLMSLEVVSGILARIAPELHAHARRAEWATRLEEAEIKIVEAIIGLKYSITVDPQNDDAPLARVAQAGQSGAQDRVADPAAARQATTREVYTRQSSHANLDLTD